MTSNRLSEEQIEDQIFNNLKIEYVSVKRQVRLHAKKVDVVYKSKRNRIVGLEVKISNWREALQQAWTNKLACHESYVALWYEYAHRVDKDLFIAAGVGLYVVNEDFTLDRLVPASRKHTLHPKIHKKFAGQISA